MSNPSLSASKRTVGNPLRTLVIKCGCEFVSPCVALRLLPERSVQVATLSLLSKLKDEASNQAATPDAGPAELNRIVPSLIKVSPLSVLTLLRSRIAPPVLIRLPVPLTSLP